MDMELPWQATPTVSTKICEELAGGPNTFVAQTQRKGCKWAEVAGTVAENLVPLAEDSGILFRLLHVGHGRVTKA